MSREVATWLGAARRHLPTCGSTNDEAAAWARAAGAAAAPHGAVVIADHQRAGRGRLGRSWSSPAAGNLYGSVVLRPRLAAEEVPAITLAAGVAVAETVNSFGARASLKWPNDVLCEARDGPRKVAGVLTEMSSQGGAIDWVIIGIGLNVATAPEGPGIAATSVAAAMKGASPVPSAAEVLEALLPRLERWVELFLAGGLLALRDRYEALLAKNLRVRAVLGGTAVSGHPIGITARGALQLLDDDGVVHEISAGEVAMVESGSR